MSDNEGLTEAQVDELETRLRAEARSRDPVPGHVVEQARQALDLRDLDTELAALVADSDDNQQLAVRGLQDARLLTFQAPGVVVELQVTGSGSERALQGQIDATGGCELTLDMAEGTVAVTPDRHGRFRLDRVPAGRLRLQLRCADRSVSTGWVVV